MDPEISTALSGALWTGSDEHRALITKEETLSYGDLEGLALRAAARLQSLGLRDGDTLAVWLPNGPDWLALFLGASLLNVLTVPVSTRYRAFDVELLLKTSRANAVAIAPSFLGIDFEGILKEISPRLPHLECVIDIEGANYQRVKADQSTPTIALNVDDCAPCCAFSTSGTTGNPKLAVHNRGSILRHSRSVGTMFGIGPNSVLLCALPLYGVIGLNSTLAAFASGASCVLQPVFKADAVADAIERYGVTHFFGSDGMFAALLDIPGKNLRSLQGGAIVNFEGRAVEIAAAYQEHFGTRLSGVYGSSECFALMAAWPGDMPVEQRAAAGGRPVDPGIEVRVVDPASGTPSPEGEPGELQVRGYNVVSGYLNNPEATEAAFDDDGWFRTGDLCATQGEGFVYFSRMKDSLRLRGYLVDPGEIEEFLMRHHAVDRAQVVGVQRPGVGDAAIAFVTLRSAGVTEEDLVQHCSAGIAAYKIPSRIVPIDAFPELQGPNGTKVQKVKLREMASALLP